MTFYIDWWEQDFPLFKRTIRIRDETRYVQDSVEEEHLINMPRLSKLDRAILHHQLLKLLCDKWFKQFGERIEPVAPEHEAEAWTIQYVEVLEVTDAPRHSIEAG